MPRELRPEAMVVQSNSLTRGFYPVQLKTDALRLLMSAIAKLDQDADMFGDVHLSSAEMRRLFTSYRNNNRYAAKIEEAAEKIMGLIAHVNLPGGGWQKLSLIRKTIYSHGAVQIIFDPEAKPLLLRLQSGNYTAYPVSAIASMSTTSEILMYQWAKSYAHKGHWVSSTTEVRAALNKSDTLYKDEHRFIKWVLKPTIEAINNDENADLVISAKPLKRGRITYAYSFKASLKESANLSVADKVAIQMLIEEGVSPAAANKALRNNGCSQCLRSIAMLKLRTSRADQAPLLNKSAYLAKLILDGAEPDENDPSFIQINKGLMLHFRKRVFEQLTPEAKKAHTDSFAQGLTGRTATDWTVHKSVEATGNLVQAWNEYLNQYIANSGAGILITKSRTVKLPVGASTKKLRQLPKQDDEPEQLDPISDAELASLEEGDEI